MDRGAWWAVVAKSWTTEVIEQKKKKGIHRADSLFCTVEASTAV